MNTKIKTKYIRPDITRIWCDKEILVCLNTAPTTTDDELDPQPARKSNIKIQNDKLFDSPPIAPTIAPETLTDKSNPF